MWSRGMALLSNLARVGVATERGKRARVAMASIWKSYMAGIETEVNKTRSAVEGDVLSCNKIIFDSAGAGTGTCREFLILYRYRYIFF